MKSLQHFLARITAPQSFHERIVAKQRSFFLSLTFPDLEPVIDMITAITAGCDAAELRVDLLHKHDKDFISSQIALLRRCTALPIIFTIRTKSQGGNWPDREEQSAIELMQLAGRLAVEYIDFEMTWSEKALEQVRSSAARSKLIASHHDVSGELSFRAATWVEYYNKGCQIGDIVKLVGRAREMDDNFALANFKEKIRKESGRPLIAINMGSEGMLSRVLNDVLTPVTHELMPSKAAPGQMSIKEINTTLTLLGQLSKKEFYIFGTPIAHSRSPALHNAGFNTLGLPHVYSRAEQTDVKSYRELLADSAFGGASVTIPHKQSILPFMTEVTDHVRAIGAMNTIIPIPGGLRGENTDWTGIMETLRKRSAVTFTGTSGLVIGAGGTARAAVYALQKLQCGKIYLLNRSRPNVDELIKSFPNVILITTLAEAGGVEGLSAAVSTVPGDGAVDEKMGELLKVVLARRVVGATLVEMAYKPAFTGIMKLAEESGWQTVPGLEALVEQGIRQFELWTGFNLPADIARQAVLGTLATNETTSPAQKVVGNWQDAA